ncbi:TPA: hypothetical protein MYK93_005195 [Klebsiella pneumoniae]|uniref:Uncharacterized protein n=2 Tax=Salmonella enterica TaxID=28901 RepID=A0A5Z5G4S9_SALER|nr:hypothetical protein [Salmonella enterica]EBF9684556.1 hypothetical protein [Salmonella enterica subsp. enterica serovar Typhimurium]ECW6428283.1 hypothetical protein [Salmonella enterica subsp. enterica serovar Montevideo]EDW2276112.1 hypothetical protein [Salmonella enterica subsp. enterica serovar Enteritidis]EDZ8967315.1 hypothetical protein [Salmonella enterica subsp. enterica serovar Muenchen]EEJ9978848.1 hypothetical protein [Salmonella enterica subsp. enterica serovar Newport]EFN37
MAKIRFENTLDKMIFEIRGHESYSEMETVLLDFCDETMGVNHPDEVAEYPVYYKHFINDKISYEHIGYVRLGTHPDDDSCYMIEHLTTDRKILKNYWHPFYFYKGECEYGFKN